MSNQDRNSESTVRPVEQGVMPTVRVREIEQTCGACPAQWEGWTDDNRQIYIRYRGGILRVSVGEQGDDSTFAAVSGREILRKVIGGIYDGYMTYDELKEHTAGVVEWPERRIM